jgi:hypothetical protein
VKPADLGQLELAALHDRHCKRVIAKLQLCKVAENLFVKYILWYG